MFIRIMHPVSKSPKFTPVENLPKGISLVCHPGEISTLFEHFPYSHTVKSRETIASKNFLLRDSVLDIVYLGSTRLFVRPSCNSERRREIESFVFVD